LIIHRIWSTDWFKNRESESQRLLNALDDLIKKEKASIYQQIDTKKKAEETQKLDFWGVILV